MQDSLWRHPLIAAQLPLPVRAATGGLLEVAWQEKQRRDDRSGGGAGARLVSPMDIARITAGMGTGYLSGALVGKTLGLLTGMSDSMQEKLKNTGLWAGVVQNVIPMAFGAR